MTSRYQPLLWGMASLVAQRLKHLPGMLETWVRSLGWEDPLEKEMATHSSILAWRIPWREEPGGVQSMGSQRVRHDCIILSLTFQCINICWLSFSYLFFCTCESVTHSLKVATEIVATDPLEKEMVTHSGTLAWKIPWTEKPGGLQFMGSQRVGHDWATEWLHFHCICPTWRA